MTPAQDPSFTPFHSAVNRIPIPREEVVRPAEGDVVLPDLFGDEAPVGHDHLQPGRWTGTLDVEMTVRTPLVFGAQTHDEQGRPSVEVPRDADGRPFLPPTMVKGMISRAFELLTASRFRVFGEHDEALTYRADPANANGLLPGRVYEDGDGFGVKILDGFGKNAVVALIKDDLDERSGVSIAREGHPEIRLAPGQKTPKPEQVLARFRAKTHHGQKVKVQLSRWRGERGPERLMVTGVWVDDHLEEFFTLAPHLKPTTMDVWGYPCRTSPEKHYASDLFSQKKYERFFFRADRSGVSPDGECFPLRTEHIERYAAVLRSYQQQQQRPGGDKHLLNRAALENAGLASGSLVFVHLDEDRRALRDVYPTMVGRRSYRMSPRELAREQRVLPLSKAEQASPADRLFGYVIAEPSSGAAGGDVASRGRLVFGPVDTSSAVLRTDHHLLAPLLEPKLSSARRFLTDAGGSTPTDNRAPLPHSQYYSAGQLLGAAAYPVHRSLLDSEGFPSSPTNACGLDQSNEKVRMTARSWIAPGSVMRCRIRFENLTRNELSALIWVFTPGNLVPPSEQSGNEVGYLRMGLGKPYGLGALEVRLAEDGLHTVRTDAESGLAAAYQDLSGCLGTAEKSHPVGDFTLDEETERELRDRPWVQAMQRAAFGYSDGIPVRYMSLEENKENNKTDPKSGLPREGLAVSPGDLFASDPHPKPIRIPRPPGKKRR